MDFFKKIDTVEPFETFGTTHLITLGIMVAVCIVIVCLKNKLRRNEKFSDFMRYSLAIIMFVQQISYYIWKAYMGEYGMETILPLHLCAIAIFLSIYVLATKDKRMYPTVYFLGFCGALQALLTPDIDGYAFPHYRFFQFFLGHALIIITIVFLLSSEGIKINAKEYVKTFVMLQGFAVLGGIANIITGGNYMYLAHKPVSASLFDHMADWPFYIIQLELLALLFMAIFSIPYIIKLKKDFFKFK